MVAAESSRRRTIKTNYRVFKVLGALAVCVILAIWAIPVRADGYSCYYFNFHYNTGSDYYSGYVYAPTDFQSWLTVGAELANEPQQLGAGAMNGYYEITAIVDGLDSAYDKKEYITSYYDGNAYLGALYVNGDGSATAGSVYVSDRSAADEHGYVLGANPLASVSYENVTGSVSADNGYGWNYSYDIGYGFADFTPYTQTDGPEVKVRVDVQLTGDDPGSSLKDTWQTGVYDIWSDKYAIQNGSDSYPIEFSLNWVTANADQTVNVVYATGRDNMTTWYTDLSGWGNSYQDEAAAHEYGHMLGLYDEYSGGATDPTTHQVTSYLMGTLDGTVAQYYYNFVLNWLQGKNPGASLSLAADPTSPAMPLAANPYQDVAGAATLAANAPQSPAVSTLSATYWIRYPGVSADFAD